nr:hypothetical protein [Tanacetum cinerariifolium]
RVRVVSAVVDAPGLRHRRLVPPAGHDRRDITAGLAVGDGRRVDCAARATGDGATGPGIAWGQWPAVGRDAGVDHRRLLADCRACPAEKSIYLHL